jgi:hypothetical protein
MRPVRITGVTGTSGWVPLDTYSKALASVNLVGGAGAVEYTLDNVFDTSITPQVVVLTLTGGVGTPPNGARAVRGTGLGPTDLLIVSQQGF